MPRPRSTCSARWSTGCSASRASSAQCSGTTRRWRSPSRTTSRGHRSSTTAWTSCRRSPAPRPPSSISSASCSAAPGSCSRAGRASTRPSARSTRTSTPSRPASTSPTSGRPATRRPPPPGRRVPPLRQAREPLPEPPDQAAIPHPRIGHYAVLDERLDADLVAAVADARPDWHLVLVGPVVKIDPAALPQRPNIHYLGGKRYEELPAYLAGWDAAFMPFAINESTRFISPTKTPEYLAAGRPVVSTPVRDVVRTYGEGGLVRIAATPAEMVAALEATLAEAGARGAWLARVDRLLEDMSWDRTWAQMRDLI